ncbi:4-amino-4-deoxy-L-arabinose transferase-like glycosyltransferase [Wenyingzhuangia heitensis]|uniref:4-amino-4-deoxy-L-arabinose transferase-like glycosyltransferase n=1 Tax=Wenyingzhuangia heitensis TaxID=1487859 RepID=A0ABX0UER0_9FLAO|nr:glycosyltransferase family 39 protein [Wenyingzhuangia heitensis]NIJ46011.1 4-amino-4-deoxy-L-arabinose transferase-like glycosyltransferase [Wenyingzhuangia heitensis]
MNLLESKYTWLWVFLFAFVFCLFGNWSSIIYILDEAKNSEAAREMLVFGNLFQPTFNREIRTDKPPFHYFCMIIGYKLFGVNAFGARFFSALFGALTILSTYVFTKKHLGSQVAKITLGVLFSSFYFIQEFHLAVPDPYLIFWMSLAFFCYIEFYITQNKKILLLLYTAIGFGTLTKGPIAMVMPGLVAFVHLILYKKLNINILVRLKVFEGVLWVALISIPWFYFAHIYTDGVFTDGFFFKHNLGRFKGKMEGHGGMFLVTIGFVVLGMFPFCLWIFRALISGVKQKTRNIFVFYSALVVIVFVSFFAVSATKLPNYTMPCYPFIAILLGWWLCNVYNYQITVKGRHVEWIILMFIALVLPIGGYIGLSLDASLSAKKWLAIVLGFVPIGVGFAYSCFLKDLLKKSFLFLVATFMLLSMVLFGLIFPVLTKETPVEKYKELVETEVPVVVYKRMDAAFPINFNRTYKVVNSIEDVQLFFKQHPNGVVMTNTRNKKEINQLSIFKELFSQKSLFENHTTRVFGK